MEVEDRLDLMKAALASAESHPVRRLFAIPLRVFPAIPTANALRIATLAVLVILAGIAWRVHQAAADESPNGVVARVASPEGAVSQTGSKSKAGAEAQVFLVAMRGGADDVPHGPSGKPLLLKMMRGSLPEARGYSVEIVDGQGKAAWDGSVVIENDELSVRVSSNLRPGLYWVRLYSAPEVSGEGAAQPGDLLREFGLRLD